MPPTADDIHSTAPTRHGAYACFTVEPHARRAAAALPVMALAERLGLHNEFEPGAAGHPAQAIAFLRHAADPPPAMPNAIADDALLHAAAIVHVASPDAEPVDAFCAELTRLLAPHTARILRGVVRPMVYTGNAMHNFAYAHRVEQQPARTMPHAFLVPMSKTADWWQKDWMERHTYLLPRYDDAGGMRNEGHVLAASPGIPYLMRRTYKSMSEPAPAGEYDFVNYFECADDGVATFHQVCAALRDVERNPEWRFVREGPTWHGRRAAEWSDLFA
jgi:hypothetical protein